MLLSINEKNPQVRLIRKAVEALRNGGIIIYPTDTVYGIGCDLYNKRAIEKIHELKRRSQKQPFSFICADLRDISQYALVSNYAYPASRLVPKILMTKRQTTGIRVPANEICLSLVRELGHPIISTSASTDKDEILSDPEEIRDRYGHAVELILDGGILTSEMSSVISLVDDVPEVIRAGKGDVSEFQ
jgi:tRNA A37 threonylcarbamoyladenosine synthetase subunit TsaC/SUA5/YrdC